MRFGTPSAAPRNAVAVRCSLLDCHGRCEGRLHRLEDFEARRKDPGV